MQAGALPHPHLAGDKDEFPAAAAGRFFPSFFFFFFFSSSSSSWAFRGHPSPAADQGLEARFCPACCTFLFPGIFQALGKVCHFSPRIFPSLVPKQTHCTVLSLPHRFFNTANLCVPKLHLFMCELSATEFICTRLWKLCPTASLQQPQSSLEGPRWLGQLRGHSCT